VACHGIVPLAPLLPPRPPLQVQEKRKLYSFCLRGSAWLKKTSRGAGAVGALGARTAKNQANRPKQQPRRVATGTGDSGNVMTEHPETFS
jgi:hypothetical protein